jgi:hypothetical protein
MYSFGYGFVEYSKPEDAKIAIDTLKGYPIQVNLNFHVFFVLHRSCNLRHINFLNIELHKNQSNTSNYSLKRFSLN